MKHLSLPVLLQSSALMTICTVIGGGCSSSSTSHGGAGTTYYSDTGRSESYAPPATTQKTTTEAPPAQPTQETVQSGSELVIPLYQENVVIGKREVDAGTIRLHKVVRTETVKQPIELRRETITIDRQPGSGDARTAELKTQGQPFQEQDFTIQLKREEPVIETQVVQSGRIVAQKQAQQETTTVQRQARHEDIAVDKGTAQDVRISDAIATGAASSPGAESQGSGASSPSASTITDVDSLLQTTDANSIYGRPVRLSNVNVKEVVDPHLITLVGDRIQTPLYVHLPQPVEELKAGDKVNLTGVVQDPSTFSTIAADVSGSASQAVNSQPLFVETKSVQLSRQ